MTNESFSEKLKQSRIDNVSKYSLQELANFIDWYAESKDVNEYYHSQLFLVVQKLNEGVKD